MTSGVFVNTKKVRQIFCAALTCAVMAACQAPSSLDETAGVYTGDDDSSAPITENSMVGRALRLSDELKQYNLQNGYHYSASASPFRKVRNAGSNTGLKIMKSPVQKVSEISLDNASPVSGHTGLNIPVSGISEYGGHGLVLPHNILRNVASPVVNVVKTISSRVPAPLAVMPAVVPKPVIASGSQDKKRPALHLPPSFQ